MRNVAMTKTEAASSYDWVGSIGSQSPRGYSTSRLFQKKTPAHLPSSLSAVLYNYYNGCNFLFLAAGASTEKKNIYPSAQFWKMDNFL